LKKYENIMFRSRKFIFFFLIIYLGYASGGCTFKSAKWSKGSPKVSLTSTTQKNKILVDWSALIVNKECADNYDVWIWRDGQQKTQGKKFTVSDKNTLTKILDIEPCLNHNIAVELKKGKSTETAKFNSATIPTINLETMGKYLSVGYYKNPATGLFDVSKASVKVKKEFLTFMNCIKHLEISGVSKKREGTVKTTSISTPVKQTSGEVSSWIPYGTGRSFGENGYGKDRKWMHIDGKEVKRQTSVNRMSSSVSSTTIKPKATTKSSWGYKPPQGTPAPTSPRGGWSYQELVQKKKTSSLLQNAAGPSIFTDKFLRMKDTSSTKKSPLVKESPPFRSDDVELVVPVEPCTQYTFELKIISPNNAVVGSIPDILLPKLSDIPDYVPPPASEAVEVKFGMGGKYDVVAKQPHGPIPDSCLLDYFEALDAFANRVEAIANEKNAENAVDKSVQDKIQDDVEKTQSESLHLFGCRCTSPRLEIEAGQTSPDFAGVYLYQGISNGKPYFKQDNEEKSVANKKEALPGTPLLRRKRFIGRVDGGGQSSSTTARNWMQPGQGSTYPAWRDYFGITTQAPGTYGGGSSLMTSSRRDSSSSILGSTIDCPSQNMNLNLRSNAHEIGSVSSWRECARKCSEMGSCQYFVWNTQKYGPKSGDCTLMDGFGSKRFDANTVAGRWDCKYYGSTDTDTKSPSSPSSPSVSGAGGFVTPSRGGSRSPSLSGGSSPPSLSGRGNYPPSYPSPGGKSPTSSSGRTNPWFPSPSTSVSEPKKKVDHFLFWDSKKNQWAVSEQLGGSRVDLTGPARVTTKCPADNSQEVWSVNNVKVLCSPDY